MAKENPGLFAQIREWLAEFVAKLRKAFEGVQARSTEAKAMMQYAEELQQMWDSALIGATQNVRNNTQAKADNGSNAADNVASSGQGKASVRRNSNGDNVVVVEEDILNGVPEEDWRSTVQRNLKQKFPDGIAAGRSIIKIDRQSRREMTYSKYTRYLKNNLPDRYADKLRATNNADEIIQSTRNYVNEGLNHPRKDDIVDFARGNIKLRIGNNDYNADVIVAMRENGELLFYDMLNLEPDKFILKNTKEADTGTPTDPLLGARRSPASTSGNSISRDIENDNTKNDNTKSSAREQTDKDRDKRQAEINQEIERLKKTREERLNANPNYLAAAEQRRYASTFTERVAASKAIKAAAAEVDTAEIDSSIETLRRESDALRDAEKSEYEAAMEKYGGAKTRGYSQYADTRTAELDGEYEKAVKSGDKKRQRALVLEAAERAMPNSVIRDGDGKLKPVYHYTNNNFTKFDRSRARTGNEMGGFFFAPDAESTREYGSKRISAFLNITNPAYDPYLDRKHNDSGTLLREKLAYEGYDGVIRTENGRAYEYMAFDPEQIKSAELITYDDAGNVIPLSERFNSERDDIRYSMRDSEGSDRDARGGVSYSINPTFEREIDSWNGQSDKTFKLGTTSNVLISIGVADREVQLHSRKLGSIFKKHPEMTKTIIKQVPQILENPVIVLKSKGMSSRLVIFGDVQDERGSPVMAVLELDPRTRDGKTMDINILANAYGKDNSPAQFVRDSELVYIDRNKNRADKWMQGLGLPLPSDTTIYGSVGRVSYQDGSVKVEGTSFDQYMYNERKDVSYTSRVPVAKTPMQIAMERAQASKGKSSMRERDNAADVKTAEKYFGTTYKIAEAGYLLTDGKLLDFSGRHEGAPGGYRSVDHRDISDAFDGDYGDDSYTGGMIQFMQAGNIRPV